MKLLTTIPLETSEYPISYRSKSLLIGSCFSENIGNKLRYYKYQTSINPFGILFHPKAIECFLHDTINIKQYTKNDIFKNNNLWHCFDAHSSLSNTNPTELLNNLNNKISKTRKYVEDTTHLIITLGTSWVYNNLVRQKVVANCHKLPQKEFRKEILEISDITKCLLNINTYVKTLNPEIKIIYTVSPIRHLKDGFVENQRSKAHLISAIHQVLSDTVFYFPSYEIMMDELRDYRFYNEDMIHPNKTALNYIWNKFSEVWLDSCCQVIHKQVTSIQKRLEHRPFNKESTSYKKFKIKLNNDVIEFNKKYPNIKF